MAFWDYPVYPDESCPGILNGVKRIDFIAQRRTIVAKVDEQVKKQLRQS
jgi:hypothetical protein